ncbi:MAG TPA: matrixin family metalloprotease [Candidatus Melainabacteria bacterium]|nr:matrixin family metalloprotease [Candidatus Melainabacteria bacterium]
MQMKSAFVLLPAIIAALLVATWIPQASQAQFRSSYGGRQLPPARPGGGGGRQAAAAGPAGVYPQALFNGKVVRWVADQMPLKVFVSRGSSIDGFMDPELGVPRTNVDGKQRWPHLVAEIIENGQINNLPVSEGFVEPHYEAALQGINLWKGFEREGLFQYVLTNDPSEADIYVFWTHHFVNKLGLGLFANDIRGYTSKEIFDYKLVLQGKQPLFQPVVILLRTTNQQGNPMSNEKMRASAGHEFGHALGIDQHSTNPYDLMSVYYGRGVVSNNDAATIRYIYKHQPDYIP